eukprot:TRINITY_DN12184_c0_g1_i1.p1 TRINITY_DN12184_c0_g1~~TRINITY_DN12184_c0_g1_i1.p1  ORF type:complete len:148 (-),score=46.96 TRINITY_DN12184_c0_g1_i1:22-465(-)
MEIAVIGAGASGLSAARTLLNAGYRVKIFEGRDRVGGRLYTDPNTGMDLGASWIHYEFGNPITNIANENAIPLIESPKILIMYDQQGGLIPEDIVMKMRILNQEAEKDMGLYPSKYASYGSVPKILEKIVEEKDLTEVEKQLSLIHI